jgi:hypothetical protein
MITQQGALNTTALVVPDLYVQLVPPNAVVLNGVPSNVVGVVGSASWGPVGAPVIIGSMTEYAAGFGPVMDRGLDMGTHVAIAVQQGANAFRCLRVTDGTDEPATAPGTAGCITFTARHSGSLGNAITVALDVGSMAGSWAATIGLSGLLPERFDNITGTGDSFWNALAAAINAGTGTRSASVFVTASASGGTTAPVAARYALAGGSDGATGVTAASLIGTDTAPRLGMYALRGQGCAILDLCDCTDATQWSTVEGFAAAEGLYAMLTGPSADTLTNAIATKALAELDSSAVKLLFGDWLWWWDAANETQRLVSPQAFAAGRLANLSPEQSGLNKPLSAIGGSQTIGSPASGLINRYSAAELGALFEAGIDVITNPGAGGQLIWTLRLGHNSSTDASINGDNYTRLTNYIAATLAAGMGIYVGKVVNAALLRNIRSTLLGYLSGLLSQGLLGSTDGTLPFAVICDTGNNPFGRLALGYVQADVQIRYQGITEKFLVNLDGGATVLVSTTSTGTSGSGTSGGSGSGSGSGSGAGSGGSGSGSGSSETLTFQIPPTGIYAPGQASIGVNATLHPGSATAAIQFGFSTSATVAPTAWTAGIYVNTQGDGDALYAAYLTAPSGAGTYYGWVATTDGAVSAVSASVTVS